MAYLSRPYDEDGGTQRAQMISARWSFVVIVLATNTRNLRVLQHNDHKGRRIKFIVNYSQFSNTAGACMLHV